MVRLASIEFAKLKNVRPGSRLTFPETGAVLLGKNGTGKTTLLQYLVALCTVDTSAFVSDEPFDVSAIFHLQKGTSATLRLEGGPWRTSAEPPEGSSTLARYLARYLPVIDSTKVIFNITLPDDNTAYSVVIENGRAELSCDGKPVCPPISVANPQIQLFGCVFKLAELVGKTKGSMSESLISSIAIEFEMMRGSLYRYDEGLEYFRLLTDADSGYLTYEMIVSTKKEPSGPRIQGRPGNMFRLPDSLKKALMDNWRATPESESFSLRHTQVDFLADFVRLCNFSGASIITPIESRRAIQGNVHYEWKSFRFAFDLDNDRISHARLSFGEKRLLAYLYYLACNRNIGVADELVNGMHHEWIEYCLGAACANRQMFYTSQNPLLLDFLVFQSEAEVSERFVTCSRDAHDGFVWENFDVRIGEEFYRLYKTGIQHVSDILRTKGWW